MAGRADVGTEPTLDGMRVGLSGAIPSRDVSGDVAQWNARDIMTTVARLTHRVLAEGGCLLHGAHPTLLPVIESAALSLRAADVPIALVELFVVVPFLRDYQYREFFEHKRHDGYAIVHPFGSRSSNRDEALTEMRQALVGACDVLVCVGGELHVTGIRRPGVLVEVELAKAQGKPVILAGGAGGESRRLMLDGADGPDAQARTSSLVRHQNGVHLIGAPPGRTIRLVMQGLHALRQEIAASAPAE